MKTLRNLHTFFNVSNKRQINLFDANKTHQWNSHQNIRQKLDVRWQWLAAGINIFINVWVINVLLLLFSSLSLNFFLQRYSLSVGKNFILQHTTSCSLSPSVDTDAKYSLFKYLSFTTISYVSELNIFFPLIFVVR